MNNTINQTSAAGSPPSGSKLQVVKLVNDVVNGRKNWKRSKCGAQPIWPPALEAALIEGLQTYVPVDSRETRLLGRFPMRNRYLSDYILRTTGEFRSPKQVGSRLQQLRDPRVGTQVHELLSHGVPKRVHTRARSRPDDHLDSPDMNRGAGPYSEPSSSGMSSPESRTSLDSSLAYPALGGALRPRTRVIIDILPPGSAVPTSTAVLPSANSLTTPDGPFLPSFQPRPISAIDPVVTLLSPSTLHATSFFSVISAGRRSVHTGVSALNLVGPCPTPSPSSSASWEASEQLLYRTRLVPMYWKEICDSPDPTQYTILHDVIPCFDPMTSPGRSDDQRSSIFSAVYEFRYPSPPSTSHALQSLPLPLPEAPSPTSRPPPQPRYQSLASILRSQPRPQSQAQSQSQSQPRSQPQRRPQYPVTSSNPPGIYSLKDSRQGVFNVELFNPGAITPRQPLAQPYFDMAVRDERFPQTAQLHIQPRLGRDEVGELEFALGPPRNPAWPSP